jgi:hypothetical protein
MKSNSQRFDFVFSYWIFIWYLLYMLKIVIYNPKWALMIALIENTFALALMFFYKNSFINIFLFKNSNKWFEYIKKDNDPGPFTYYAKQFLKF